MLTLARALLKGVTAGDPLPEVFPAFSRAGIRPRRAQVTMIAGQPSAGKSALAQWYATELAKKGLTGLYFSADTDAGTVLRRGIAMLTGHDQRIIAAGLADGSATGYYEDILEEVANVRWVFESSPTLDDIDLEMAAYEEMYGQYPDVVYIDNILNVAFDNGDEWSSIRELSKVLHHLTRKTGCAFIALHHASEAEGKPEYPPARKALLGKISQMPELVLGIARQGEEFRVACLKNRSGPADPSGREYITLWCDLDRMQFRNNRYEAIALGIAR